LREFIRAADKRLDDYLARLDASDIEDGATTNGARTKNLAEKIEALRKKRGRYEAMLAQLDRTGEDQISLTDPDSRAMAAHTRIAVGYNVQVAVDSKNKMIVEQAVTNQVVDMGLLTQTAAPARDVLEVETIDVVADRGYLKSRTSRPARRPAAFLMSPSLNEDRRCVRASSARTSSDTTLVATPTSARAGNC
jgi:hypothetical protein